MMNTKFERVPLRVPGLMLVELDAAVERRRASRPYEVHSRNSVAREALVAMLAAEAAPAPAPAVRTIRVRKRPAASI